MRGFFLIAVGLNYCRFFFSHLSKFNISRVPQDLTIRLFVAGVANQLSVPHSKVMFAICPRRKYGDGRPAANQGKVSVELR